jgi:hypothetical protein
MIHWPRLVATAILLGLAMSQVIIYLIDFNPVDVESYLWAGQAWRTTGNPYTEAPVIVNDNPIYRYATAQFAIIGSVLLLHRPFSRPPMDISRPRCRGVLALNLRICETIYAGFRTAPTPTATQRGSRICGCRRPTCQGGRHGQLDRRPILATPLVAINAYGVAMASRADGLAHSRCARHGDQPAAAPERNGLSASLALSRDAPSRF